MVFPLKIVSKLKTPRFGMQSFFHVHDIAPQRPTTRFFIWFWYFGTTILIASYTANLANELIVESSGTTVMRTLADNAQKQLGCQSGVAVCTYLQLTEPREHV